MRARISMSLRDDELRPLAIWPAYRDSDRQAIIKELVKHRASWPMVQMSLGEYIRRAMGEGVSAGDALCALADEMIPFAIEFKGPESVLALAQL